MSHMIGNTYNTKSQFQKKISDKLNLKRHQTVYIKEQDRIIQIHIKEKEGTIPIIISKNLTRIYKNRKYHTTRICIPLEIIKKCALQKQDEFDFNYSKNIITMHKIIE